MQLARESFLFGRFQRRRQQNFVFLVGRLFLDEDFGDDNVAGAQRLAGAFNGDGRQRRRRHCLEGASQTLRVVTIAVAAFFQ